MQPKFIHIKIVEGFSNIVDRVVNVDHIIQFEPSQTASGQSNVYLSNGKVLTVYESFEKLLEKFNGIRYSV
jgi:hypothetical protein